MSLRDNKRLWVLSAICVLIAATFAYPAISLERPDYRALIVLDITQSMNTLDYSLEGTPVSRLEFVRRAADRALLDLPCGSEIGLALFTEYRTFLLLAPVEVCANYQELSQTLRGINGQWAWSGGSEIAKALNTGLRLASDLDPPPALVFITDGHEAPPLHPQHQPRFGEDRVPGVLIGVGGFALSPIPKFDPEGKPLGYWDAGDVLQTDTYSMGRGQTGETLVDPEGRRIMTQKPTGTEHLSSLKEQYLRQVAAKTGLSYQRLEGLEDLDDAIKASGAANKKAAKSDLRWVVALVALAALILLYSPLTRRT